MRQNLTLSPSLECSGTMLAHCSHLLSGSSNPPASGSQVARTTGTHHHACLFFVFSVELRFHHVGQVDLELHTVGDLPALASQSSLAVICEILVHPSPKQYTLHPICSLLSLTLFPPFPRVPKVHCVIFMPLHPHSLAPIYD